MRYVGEPVVVWIEQRSAQWAQSPPVWCTEEWRAAVFDHAHLLPGNGAARVAAAMSRTAGSEKEKADAQRAEEDLQAAEVALADGEAAMLAGTISEADLGELRMDAEKLQRLAERGSKDVDVEMTRAELVQVEKQRAIERSLHDGTRDEVSSCAAAQAGAEWDLSSTLVV
jgi:hypothetical protein